MLIHYVGTNSPDQATRTARRGSGGAHSAARLELNQRSWTAQLRLRLGLYYHGLYRLRNVTSKR